MAKVYDGIARQPAHSSLTSWTIDYLRGNNPARARFVPGNNGYIVDSSLVHFELNPDDGVNDQAVNVRLRVSITSQLDTAVAVGTTREVSITDAAKEAVSLHILRNTVPSLDGEGQIGQFKQAMSAQLDQQMKELNKAARGNRKVIILPTVKRILKL